MNPIKALRKLAEEVNIDSAVLQSIEEAKNSKPYKLVLQSDKYAGDLYIGDWVLRWGGQIDAWLGSPYGESGIDWFYSATNPKLGLKITAGSGKELPADWHNYLNVEEGPELQPGTLKEVGSWLADARPDNQDILSDEEFAKLLVQGWPKGKEDFKKLVIDQMGEDVTEDDMMYDILNELDIRVDE